MADEPQKNDIDFDELDKAVASLMGKVGNETLEDDERTKTLAINSTLKPDQAPKYDELEKTAEKIGDETLVMDSEVSLPDDLSKLPNRMNLPAAELAPAQTPVSDPVAVPTPEVAPQPVVVPDSAPAPKAPVVPRPNSGRFMDMVHPKADMRTTSPPPNLIVPSRAPVTPKPAPVSEQPETTTADEAPVNPLMDTPLVATPFLPDAKVEKRPLGGSIPTIAPLTPANEILSAVEKSTVTPEPESEEEEAIVETTSINSEDSKKSNDNGDSQRALNPGDFEKESSTEQALAQIEITEEKAEEPPETIEKVESGDTENLKSGKMTYQEAQKEAAPESAAIYDVKNYHQPLAHPKKQKSGWGIVLIIVIIIVLAAALGAAAYFMLGLGS